MNTSQTRSHLGWLSIALAAQRGAIANLLSRLKGIATRASSSLDLHAKFLNLMGQVAHDRDKELDILNEIESVERRHSELRQRKLLRQASPEIRKKLHMDEAEFKEEEKPRRKSLMGLIAFFCFFSPSPSRERHRDPTVT